MTNFFAAAFLSVVLALPTFAELDATTDGNLPQQSAAGDEKDKHIIAYLIDVENQSQAQTSQVKFAEKKQDTEFMAKVDQRKEEVTKVYDVVKKSGEKQKDDSADKDSKKLSIKDLSEGLKDPINERTFPAWFPQKKDIVAVYQEFIKGVQNDLMEQDKGLYGEEKELMADYERQKKYGDPEDVKAVEEKLAKVKAKRERIIRIYANNEVAAKDLGEKIGSADKFKCVIEGGTNCGGAAGSMPTVGVMTYESVERAEDNRPVKLVSKTPGGSLQKEPPKYKREKILGLDPVALVAGGVVGGTATAALLVMTMPKGRKKRWTQAKMDAAAVRKAGEAEQDAEETAFLQAKVDADKAKAAQDVAAQAAAHEAMYGSKGYYAAPAVTLTPNQQKVVDDIVKKQTMGADLSSPDDNVRIEKIVDHIERNRKLQRYGYGEANEAAVNVEHMVRDGRLKFPMTAK